MDKSSMLTSLQEHYKFKKDADFARFLGITSQVLTNWKTRNSFDAQLIYTKCLDVNPEWLLTGRGEMIRAEARIPEVGKTIPPQSGCENCAFKDLIIKDKDKLINILEDNAMLLKEKIYNLSLQNAELQQTKAINAEPQQSTTIKKELVKV